MYSIFMYICLHGKNPVTCSSQNMIHTMSVTNRMAALSIFCLDLMNASNSNISFIFHH